MTLQEAMRNIGIEYTDNLFLNQGRKRFKVCAADDGMAGWIDNRGAFACFGNWRTEVNNVWFDNTLDKDQLKIAKEELDISFKKEKEEREKQHNDASQKAFELFSNASYATNDHEYILRKHIRPDNLRIDSNNRLMVPIYNEIAKLISIQYIAPDGTKRNFPGADKKGGFLWIGDPTKEMLLLVAEGYATGDSINQATNLPVCITFGAENLESIVDILKKVYPKNRIIICADRDKSGIGEEKAKKCNIEYILPEEIGDFNDMAVSHDINYLMHYIIDFTKKDKDNIFRDMLEWAKSNEDKKDFIIDKLMSKESLCMLFGESGSGKSFVALDMAFCISQGIDFYGYEVKKPRKVLYIIGEGNSGVKDRIKSLEKYKYPTNLKNMFFANREPINLSKSLLVDEFIEKIRKTGCVPEVVFIDTLNCNMTGDENTQVDSSVFLRNIKKINKMFSAATLLIHHPSKQDKSAPRGSSTMNAAMDFVYKTSKDGRNITMEITKLKDAEGGGKLNFTLISHEENEGATLNYRESDDINTEKVEVDSSISVFEGLKNAINNYGIVSGLSMIGKDNKVVTLDEWKSETYKLFDHKNKLRIFNKEVKDLLDAGIVINEGTNFRFKRE